GRSTVLALNPSLDLGAAPFPADNAKDTYWTVGVTDMIGVSANSKQKQLGRDFVSFLARQGQNALWAKLTGSIAVRDFKLGINFPPSLAGLKAALKAGKVATPKLTSQTPNPDVTNLLGSEQQGLFTGQKTIDQMLQDADAAAAKGLAS